MKLVKYTVNLWIDFKEISTAEYYSSAGLAM